MSYTGKQIFMDTLMAEGVRYIFGNPGTTELPVIDSLHDYPDIDYVLCLQEAVAVSMADAYALATDTVGVVNLHVAPGLGNGLGSVYNAWEGGTPLLVTAGQQDSRLRLREPMLGHDLVAMAAPLTKWSVEAHNADELPLILNRAFKTAREAPSGPVFVSLPLDVMEQRTEHPPMPPSRLFPRTRADSGGIAEAAEMLRAARETVIVCGDGVARGDAVDELVALAEATGAAVYADVLPARLNFPNQHPHFRDRMARDQSAIRARMGGAEVILLVGGQFFEEVWFVDTPPFPEHARIIQLEASGASIGRNYRVDCGLVGDLKLTLSALARQLDANGEDAGEREAAIRARREEHVRSKEARRERQRAKAASRGGNLPMSTATLMAELAKVLPEDTAVTSEAITGSPDVLHTLDFRDRNALLGPRGGGIGQGLPSAIALKLAQPARPVLAISGDGSALYTIQALWTAAHRRLDMVFLILNNGTYRVLKINMDHYRHMSGIARDRGYPYLDLDDPRVDFVSAAAGFRVPGQRVEKVEEVIPAVEAAFAAGGPYLLDVLVDQG